MGRPPKHSAPSKKSGSTSGESKYDAEFKVMKKTYGNFADLRRELGDSAESKADRTRLLTQFSICDDKQRAWLLLEDYFEHLSLSHKDFNNHSQGWWNTIMETRGNKRLEETALAFMRSGHPLPPELFGHANFDRFAELENQEASEELSKHIETWLFPGGSYRNGPPKSSLRVLCEPVLSDENDPLYRLVMRFLVFRPRTGERFRSPQEIIDLTQRASQEQELFQPADWAFIKWAGRRLSQRTPVPEQLELAGIELLEWLSEWGSAGRFEDAGSLTPLRFKGNAVTIEPHITHDESGRHFLTQQLVSNESGERTPFTDAKIIGGPPNFVMVSGEIFLLHNAPSIALMAAWTRGEEVEISKLNHRLITRMSRRYAQDNPLWNEVCDTHSAAPRMVFEIESEVVRIQLEAISESDRSVWFWDGETWQKKLEAGTKSPDRPELLDDPRLGPAIEWLNRLDCFSPEPGLWVNDAEAEFFEQLRSAWDVRPGDTEFLGNPLFHRLFLGDKKLRPRIAINTTGIDWFSVSTDWEIEGMKLTPADLKALQDATSRFVNLPDSGWVELDEEQVHTAHEFMADVGVDGLMPVPQKISFAQAGQLDIQKVDTVGDAAKIRELREKIANFRGYEDVDLPDGIHAELRPYQKDGFSFLANLFQGGLGGLLADDMGLGKTLQTLVALQWVRKYYAKNPGPSLVICPASVLHNWKRESNRFVPSMKVLVLESGKERHHYHERIPEFDLVVTNYSLLRRDLQVLKKFKFLAVVLDEAQFIKNPGAQVTQSVKQLNAFHRVALTGTPLENRLLDLWSIVDFLQKGYLGSQSQFLDKYQPNGEAPVTQRIARRRLSARLRPILLRRLKTQVARDLPERIEERRDCHLGKAQRKLYLAELRRSREQVNQVVQDNGINKSKIHVLAALTRLRQICCHPKLVGSDSISGKTQTLFELVEPLLERGEKVLLFSQFVRMLEILETEFQKINQKTYMLTGETRNRQEVVQQFQNDSDPSIFLLSLRAAGTGLNLTTASYVILYDPWWNPAVEAQAIDRSHRIGQTRTVNAYRLVTPGTVEEKIWELQQKKSQQISDILGEDGFTQCLSGDDLDYLFAEDEDLYGDL